MQDSIGAVTALPRQIAITMITLRFQCPFFWHPTSIDCYADDFGGESDGVLKIKDTTTVVVELLLVEAI